MWTLWNKKNENSKHSLLYRSNLKINVRRLIIINLSIFYLNLYYS